MTLTRVKASILLAMVGLAFHAGPTVAQDADDPPEVHPPPPLPRLITRGNSFELWLEPGTHLEKYDGQALRTGYTLWRKTPGKDHRRVLFSTGLVRTRHRRSTYLDSRVVGLTQDKQRLYIVLYGSRVHDQRPGDDDLPSLPQYYTLHAYWLADGTVCATQGFGPLADKPRGPAQTPGRVPKEATGSGVFEAPVRDGVVHVFGRTIRFDGRRIVSVEGEPPAVDPDAYQAKADDADWQWDEAKFSTQASVKANKSDYVITAEAERSDRPWSQLIVRVKRGDDVRFEAKVHHGTPMRIVGDLLVYPEYHLHANGTQLVAYELDKKRQRWRIPLRGVGVVPHFKYTNKVSLDIDGKAAVVFGEEMVGRYVEYVDLKTGATVGHKRFPREDGK